jgi:hypothetical protein
MRNDFISAWLHAVSEAKQHQRVFDDAMAHSVKQFFVPQNLPQRQQSKPVTQSSFIEPDDTAPSESLCDLSHAATDTDSS